MTSKKPHYFAGFRLDERSELLWNGGRQYPLRPKTFALLRYFGGTAGRIGQQGGTLSALWPQMKVDHAALAVCVHESRHALGDDSRCPRFIETFHGRGYRFIAPVKAIESTAEQSLRPALHHPLESLAVGRDAELDLLNKHWARALSGRRRVIFISGEPVSAKHFLSWPVACRTRPA